MASHIRIPLPQQVFESSLGGKFRTLFNENSLPSEGHWIEVVEYTPQVFTVVDENFTEEGECFGFSAWDEEVTDLDDGYSDTASCFGMSDSLLWNKVYLTPKEFKASSIEHLIEALHHVSIGTYDPTDM
jgi:hypothetical protein